MNAKTWMILMLIVCCAGMLALAACPSDDDDDDDNDDDASDDDDSTSTGVCYYECSYFTNTTISQTWCYDTGGPQVGFDNEADCRAYAEERCTNLGYEGVMLTNLYFTMDCDSCDDTACEPEWLADYE